MTRFLIIIIFLTAGITSYAQLYDGAVNVDLNFSTPLSDKDFTGKSATGLRMGYTKFFSRFVGGGLEVSYATYDDYVPRQTYYYDGGAITTDIYNYLYYLTISGKLVYRMKPDDRFSPYASLGLGAALSDYKIFYNVYQDQDSNTRFFMRPEIGAMYIVKKYGSVAIKGSLSYDQAFNKSDYFDVKDFSAVGFQVGILLLN